MCSSALRPNAIVRLHSARTAGRLRAPGGGRPGGAVVSYIVFLVLGTAMIVGLIGGHEAGLTNWTIGEAPFVKGWSRGSAKSV